MALHNDFSDQNCSVARTLEVIGERWSLMILRDAFLGVRRFDQFQARLGISRNVLTARLSHLVEQGVLRREQYSERPPRFEYRLTSRGRDLYPVIMAMVDFGDRHAPPPLGKSRVFRHKDCGGELDKRHLRCEKCGQDVPLSELTQEKGPGFDGPNGVFGPVEERKAGLDVGRRGD